MSRRFAILVCLVMLILNGTPVLAAEAKATRTLGRDAPRAFPHANYKVDVLGAGSPMHGIQGITLGPDGALYAASITGRSIYRIDVATGASTTLLGPPRALADDLVFGPDGTLVWTETAAGIVYARGSNGKIRVLAKNMPGVNAVAFNRSRRLFVTRIANGDGLYELDLSGLRPPRVVAENIGRLNAFQFADDAFLYGPIMATGKVVKMNVETGEMSDVAGGFDLPAAVRIAPDGQLIVIEYLKGTVVRLDPASGRRQTVASLPPMADNCVIDEQGTIYVTSSAHNGITAIDPKTGAQRRITWSDFSAPGLVNIVDVDGAEQLVVADVWTPRFMDIATGKVSLIGSERALLGATGIAVHGSVYIMSLNHSPTTAPAVQVVERGTGRVLLNLANFGAPYDVKPLPDGFVVADFAAGRLTKVGNDSAHTRTTLAWDIDGPVGLADAGDGAFYVSEYKSGRVSRVDTKTNAKRVVIDRLEAPEGITLASDGRLLVVEVGRKRVLAIDVATGAATILADRLAIGLAVGSQTGPFLPTGVAVAKNGTVYVPSDVDNVMYRLTPPAP